jgi:hypothetical protein
MTAKGSEADARARSPMGESRIRSVCTIAGVYDPVWVAVKKRCALLTFLGLAALDPSAIDLLV